MNLEFNSLNETNQERAIEFKSREVLLTNSLASKSQENKDLLVKFAILEEVFGFLFLKFILAT